MTGVLISESQADTFVKVNDWLVCEECGYTYGYSRFERWETCARTEYIWFRTLEPRSHVKIHEVPSHILNILWATISQSINTKPPVRFSFPIYRIFLPNLLSAQLGRKNIPSTITAASSQSKIAMSLGEIHNVPGARHCADDILAGPSAQG
jgi:hypothetical protein